MRWPIVVGITVILSSLAWFALRTTKRDLPNPARPGGSVPLTTTRAPVAAPPSPTLGSDGPRPELPKPPTAEAAFASQTRDTEWAPATEDEIRKRYRTVRGARLAEAECRQSQCRLVVAGTEDEIGRAIADLESMHGLRGFASSLLLGSPARQPDGTVELHAFALFER